MQTNIAQYLTQHLHDGSRVVYRQCVGDTWHDATVNDVATLAARWQQALLREGLQAGERVAICARNGLTWVAIDLAALGLGLVVVPLYVDDSADNVSWCAQNADVRVLVVENSRLATAIANCVATPIAPRVVVLATDAAAPCPGAVHVDAFLPSTTAAFECRTVEANALATVCYTSGTSGRPKGVMLSHANIIGNVEQCRATKLARPDDSFLSILPLSHMFERTGGYYLPLAVGAKVTYGRGIAQIADDMRTQMPTVIFAVPRIFEKTYQRITEALAKSPPKLALFNACVARGYRVAHGGASWLDHLLVPGLRAIVAKPVLSRLGGRLRMAVVGGAALDARLAQAFIGLGLPLLQGYGLTEASPVISVNLLDDNMPESVGPPLPGVDIRLGEGGELQVRGVNVMLGYWRNDDASRLAFCSDGWLRTGDIAEIRDRHIIISGRVKDIMVMSNGEKLSPGDAEMAIQRDSAFEYAVLVAEGRPFPILLAVSQEGDAKALLARANAQLKEFPRWVRMRRVVVTTEPWTVENGLLTPTMKVKRAKVLEKFKTEIEAAYSDGKP